MGNVRSTVTMQSTRHIFLSILYFSVHLDYITKVRGVHIQTPPENTSAVVGSSVMFSCGVVDLITGDSVFWKKVTGQDFAEVISYNDWSLNSTKHEIYVKISQSAEVQYLLVTRNVEMNDEAIYECQAGGQRARAKLTVTVPVYNMTLEWDAVPPFLLNSLVNLTCQAFHSRPPAEITWFTGSVDISDTATSHQSLYNNSDGFGEVVSVLPVQVSLSKVGIQYRCIARVPGQGREEAASLSADLHIAGISSDGSMLRSEVLRMCQFQLTVIIILSLPLTT